MYISLLLKIALSITLFTAGLVGVIRAQPYDDGDLRSFLIPPDDCPMPCFMGVRPGVTTFHEAVAILEAHEWAARVTIGGTYYQSVRIARWTGRQPGFIDTSRAVTLGISRRGTVEDIFIPTTLSAGLVYPILGEPSAADMLPTLTRTRDAGGWGLLAVYDHYLLRLASAPLPCPMTLASFLHSPINIIMVAERSILNVTIGHPWDRRLFRDANRLC